MDPAARAVADSPESSTASSQSASQTASEMGSRPIGVFDSGVGGLTVARSIIDQLPNESILYVGDTAHGPYGPLPIAEVRANALGVMDELVDSGVKLLTIACNSASAAVLRDARERYTARYGIPVIEVIQPAVRRAVAATRTGRVGVIGTSATVGSRAYEDTFAAAPRRTHRGPVHHRPAAQRIHPLRRRHRQRPLRSAPHRRGPGQCPGRDG